MIIQCDQCQAKFKLDDSKITEKGAKVRCSKCKHIFTVKKEAAPAEEAAPVTEEPKISEPAAEEKPAPPAPPVEEEKAENEQAQEEEEEFGFEEDMGSDLPNEEDIFGETEESSEEEDLSGFGGGLEEEDELTWGDLGGEEEEENLEDDFEINEEDFGLGVSEKAAAEAGSEIKSSEFGFEEEDEGEAGGFGLEGEGEAGGFGLEGEAGAGAEPEAPGFGDLDLDTGGGLETAGELDTEPVAPPPAAEEQLPPEPSREREEWQEEGRQVEEREKTIIKKKKGTSPLLLFLLLVIALGGGGYYLSTSGRDLNVAGYNVGEVIDSLLSKVGLAESGPQGQIDIKNLNGYYLQTNKNGLAFIIEGSAVNNFNGTRNFIQVRANLYDGAGKVLMHQDAYCGNIISKDDISSFTKAKVESEMKSKLGKGLINSNIAPGSEVPFMVILYNTPDSLAEFDIQVLGSEDAMQKVQ